VLPSSPLPARGAPASAPPSATAVVDEEGLGAAVAAVAANRERWAKTSVAERIGLRERVIADTLAAAPDWVADACRAKRIAPWLSVSAPHGTRFSPHRDLPVPSRLRRCTGFTPRPGRDEEATDRSVRTSTERHEMRKVLKTLLPAAIVAALFAFSGSAAMAADCEAAADTPVDQLAQPDAEAAVLCLTNNERDANGLAPLSPSDVLAGAARGHADDAVAIKWWVDGADPHTNPQTGSQPADRISAAGYCPNPQSWRVAENAFWAYQTGDAASAPTPRDAVTWWMGSPGHRANILDPGLTELGVGVVPDTAAPVDGDPIASGTFVADFGTCVN
jgi:uncharacterized protein YkwD